MDGLGRLHPYAAVALYGHGIVAGQTGETVYVDFFTEGQV